jgi:hypothetical protein
MMDKKAERPPRPNVSMSEVGSFHLQLDETFSIYKRGSFGCDYSFYDETFFRAVVDLWEEVAWMSTAAVENWTVTVRYKLKQLKAIA